MGKDCCIIVDAYSTSKVLPSLLAKEPYCINTCVHIKSSPSLPSHLKHKRSYFLVNLEYDGSSFADFASLLATRLENYNIKFIIAGGESGIELADELNHYFGLPGNDHRKSQLRRDKFKMNEAARAAGLTTVDQCKSNTLGKILTWVETNELNWPIVLKPLSSQSADHVFFCHTNQEITSAFHEIANANTLSGEKNYSVLAQSFNAGQEYIVNTVSCAGQHMISEIWRIHKRPYSTIYTYAELVSSDEPDFSPLQLATYKVLDIVGTYHGAAMTEFKYESGKTPVLLETTSRLMGNSPLEFCKELLGYTQVSILLEALLETGVFQIRSKSSIQPKLRDSLYGMAAVLISDVNGKLAEDIASVFCELDTFHSANAARTGDLITATTDTLSAPGEIYLLGTREKVMADYEKIRKAESNGLYNKLICNIEKISSI